MSAGESQSPREGLNSDECPVCYESLQTSKRKLSCGHVFCHDCLAKTLSSANKDGTITRESINCPMCRHLTFLIKQPLHTCTQDEQTLQVHVCRPSTSDPSCVVQPPASHHLAQFFGPASLDSSVSRPTITADFQIFTISGQGRPMGAEDVFTVGGQAVVLGRRRGARCCPVARSVVGVVILALVMAAIIVAIPWIEPR
ncbi:RING finger protein 222 [Amia ocellicauda]|uniref:RING finger protein 222 n=1 Tax=Amia ocellicauda TaxID=2972642 RepID=UPI0034647407|nr:RN222 protein [Amia calva]